LNRYGGVTGTVQVGDPTAATIKLNVSGTIYQQNQLVCLANGSNCPASVVGANITGSGSTNYVTKWTNGTNLGASVLYDDGTNVAIGTTGPLSTLHVNSSSITGSFRITNTTGSQHFIVNGSSGSVGIGMIPKSTEANGRPMSLQMLGVLGVNDTIGMTFSNGAAGTIYPIISSTQLSGSIAIGDINNLVKNISFYGAGTESVRITSSGSVGIGTTNPRYALHVIGSINASGYVNATEVCAGSVCLSTVTGGGAGSGWLNTSTTVFLSNNGTNVSVNRTNLFVDNANNRVGIGTNSPNSTLHVVGNANVTGTIYGDLSCVDCLDATEISDIYLLDVGDTGTGDYTFNSSTSAASFRVVNTTGINHFFVNSSTGNIGFTTRSPTQKLEVNGSTNVTGNIYLNGAIVFGGGGTGASAVSGSGTANYIAKWTDISTMGNSVLYETGSKIGIGTTSPGETLQVVGKINASSDVCITGGNCLSTVGGSGVWTAGSGTIYNTTASVGIGTNSPGSLLHVNGSAASNYIARINNTNNAGGQGLYIYTADGNAGYYALRVDTIAGTKNALAVESTGNVGIGTLGPLSTLHVNSSSTTGSFRITNTTGGNHLFVNGSSGAVTLTDGRLQVTGNSPPASGVGMELAFVSSTDSGMVQAYNRSASAFKPMRISATNISLEASNAKKLIVTATGNILIGTGAPGNATGDGDLYVTGDIEYDGNLYGPGADLAELIHTTDTLEAGDVVVADPENAEHVVKATTAYDTRVVGIVSTDPSIILSKSEGNVPLALSGRVPVKVTDENGPIKPGDLLTTSNTPGHAMKCASREACQGSLVGKALGKIEKGTGTIVAVVVLG
jgi:hypothetical protein